MKTADRENPNRWAAVPSNRAHSAVSQNRSRSIKRAEKQEKLQPKEMCFFLTPPFIEQSGSHRAATSERDVLLRRLVRIGRHSLVGRNNAISVRLVRHMGL